MNRWNNSLKSKLFTHLCYRKAEMKMTYTALMFCILLGNAQATTGTFDTSNYQIISDAAATDFPANYDNFTAKCRGELNFNTRKSSCVDARGIPPAPHNCPGVLRW